MLNKYRLEYCTTYHETNKKRHGVTTLDASSLSDAKSRFIEARDSKERNCDTEILRIYEDRNVTM